MRIRTRPAHTPWSCSLRFGILALLSMPMIAPTANAGGLASSLRRSWATLQATLVAVMLALSLPGAAAAATETFTHGDTIEVVHWNIALLPSIHCKHRCGETRERGEHIAANYSTASVVTINEGFSRRRSNVVFEHMSPPFYVPSRFEPPEKGLETNGGLAIGIHRDHWAHLTLPQDRGWQTYSRCNGKTSDGSDCYAQKGVLWRRIALEGNDDLLVNIYTTHLDSGDVLGDHEARMTQLATLRAFIEDTAGPYPVIVTGDLNVDGHDCHFVKTQIASIRQLRFAPICNPTPYASLIHALTSKTLGAPRDTYIEACGSVLGKCVDTSMDPDSKLGVTAGGQQRLDYILYYPDSGDWEIDYVEGSFKIDPAYGPPGGNPRRTLSDHSIVSASFRFCSKGSCAPTARNNGVAAWLPAVLDFLLW